MAVHHAGQGDTAFQHVHVDVSGLDRLFLDQGGLDPGADGGIVDHAADRSFVGGGFVPAGSTAADDGRGAAGGRENNHQNCQSSECLHQFSCSVDGPNDSIKAAMKSQTREMDGR